MLVLDKEQQEAVDRVLANPQGGCLDISDVGTGKTEMAIALAKGLKAKTKLVLCPPGVIRQWRDRILKYYPEDRVVIIQSTKAGRENLNDLLKYREGWYLMSRALVTSKNYKVFDKKMFDFVAYDECMRMANRKNPSFKAMKKIQGRFKHAMGATPYGNRFEHSWGLTQWIWGTEGPAGSSFWRWAKGEGGDPGWCTYQVNIFTGFEEVTGERVPGAYFKTLPNVINLQTKQQEAYIVNRYVKLSPEERKLYTQYEDHLIAKLESQTVVTRERVTMLSRLRMLSLGVPDAVEYLFKGERLNKENNEKEKFEEMRQRMFFPLDTKSSKLKEIKEILAELGDKKCVIFTSSRSYADYLHHNLENSVVWHGGVSSSQREKIKQEFIQGNARVFIGQIASVAEGLDGLQLVCNHEIWTDQLVGNDVMNEQARGRLNRRGQEKTVVRYNIIAENTEDEDVLTKNKQKKLRRLLSLNKD